MNNRDAAAFNETCESQSCTSVQRLAYLKGKLGLPDEVHCHAEAVRKCSRHSTADLAALQGCGQQIQTQLVSTKAKTKASKAGHTCGQQKGCGLDSLQHVCRMCRPHGLHRVWLPVFPMEPVAAGSALSWAIP